MARPPDKPAAFPTPCSPISEREHEGFSDYADPPSGGCLGRFCCWWDDGSSSGHNRLLQQEGAHGDSWPVANLKKIREYSEMVAGPKWKNFIRRMGRQCNPNRAPAPAPAAQFQYSPESYALNFGGGDVGENGTLLHSFSSRYASHAPINDHQRRPAAS